MCNKISRYKWNKYFYSVNAIITNIIIFLNSLIIYVLIIIIKK